MFFQPDQERGHPRFRREHRAKQVCAACPVRQACLDHALVVGEAYGIWGGLTASERCTLSTHRGARRHW